MNFRELFIENNFSGITGGKKNNKFIPLPPNKIKIRKDSNAVFGDTYFIPASKDGLYYIHNDGLIHYSTVDEKTNTMGNFRSKKDATIVLNTYLGK